MMPVQFINTTRFIKKHCLSYSISGMPAQVHMLTFPLFWVSEKILLLYDDRGAVLECWPRG